MKHVPFHKLSRIATVLACALLAACAMDKPEEFGTYEATVVAQLDASAQALAAHGLSLQLVGYTPSSPLATDDDVRAAKAEILDGTAMVPRFNGVDASSFAIDSIAQRMQAHRAGTDDQDVVANIETMALPRIKPGQKSLDVTWQSGGHEFQTKLVYDDNGVVYDNMLSNLAFVQAEEVSAELPPAQPSGAAQTGVTAFANQSFTSHFISFDIQWIWGGQRGHVALDHFVISCDGWVSFCDDGGASNAWMTLGSADGRTHRNALRKPRISKLAWAYGWATPTASFSISFNSSDLTFSASTGGVGSAGKGAGIHAII